MESKQANQLTIRLIEPEDEEQAQHLVYYRIFAQTIYDIIWINYKRKWFLTSLCILASIVYWIVSDSFHPVILTMMYTLLFPAAFFVISRWVLLPVSMALNAQTDAGTGLYNHWSSHPDRRMWVGIYGGKLVATAAVKRNTGTTAEVHRVATHQDYIGRGFARRMMQQIFDYCHEAGFQEILLETSEAQIPAQTLYKKLGFKEYRVYWHFNDVIALCRAHCFQKKLRP